MWNPGDLVEVTDIAAIPALIGSVGIIVRRLGVNPSGGEDHFYEVDVSSHGYQILIEKELRLVREANKK